LNQPSIVKPCSEKVFQQNGVYCRYDANAVVDFVPQMLSSQYWQTLNAISGTAQGRGTTWFITAELAQQTQHWVLRHYYRGGLVGKVLTDQYLFIGQGKTRAAQEFKLLKALQALGLPAPRPIAYRVIKKGLCYRADLLSSRIENANDLVAILSERNLPETLWQEIGKVIRRFHQQGIYHHDLNAHNILIDEQQKVWLIDFDRGEIRSHQQRWPEENMARLLRSFRKESGLLKQFFWHEKNWQALLSGYQS
jgi:3-deoxy-D-manno-octulosonic acid kinase